MENAAFEKTFLNVESTVFKGKDLCISLGHIKDQ